MKKMIMMAAMASAGLCFAGDNIFLQQQIAAQQIVLHAQVRDLVENGVRPVEQKKNGQKSIFCQKKQFEQGTKKRPIQKLSFKSHRHR